MMHHSPTLSFLALFVSSLTIHPSPKKTSPPAAKEKKLLQPSTFDKANNNSHKYTHSSNRNWEKSKPKPTSNYHSVLILINPEESADLRCYSKEHNAPSTLNISEHNPTKSNNQHIKAYKPPFKKCKMPENQPHLRELAATEIGTLVGFLAGANNIPNFV